MLIFLLLNCTYKQSALPYKFLVKRIYGLYKKKLKYFFNDKSKS